jgi:hypothetical protein
MIAATAPAAARAPTAVAPDKPVRLWLWLPLTPLFWLLSPLALLFAPLVWLGLPPPRSRNPYAAALAIGAVLVSLGGTVIDIRAPGARLFIRIF